MFESSFTSTKNKAVNLIVFYTTLTIIYCFFVYKFKWFCNNFIDIPLNLSKHFFKSCTV